MTTATSGVHSANADLAQSIRMWRLWVFLSWQDIKQRYRGSFLGPFWTAGGLAALALGAGFLYSRILHTPYREFLPFVTLSVGIWTLLSGTLSEATGAFLTASSVIKNTPIPIAVQVFRVVSRNVIVLAHNALVVLAVFLVLQRPLAPTAPLAIPGLLLILVNLVWSTWLVAALAARYRDAIQIVNYMLQFILFITPIFWKADMLGRARIAVEWNPFWHLIELMRAPILGDPVLAENWIYCGVMAVVGSIAAYVVQMRFRNAVVFWV